MSNCLIDLRNAQFHLISLRIKLNLLLLIFYRVIQINLAKVAVLEDLIRPNAHHYLTDRVIESHHYQIGDQS